MEKFVFCAVFIRFKHLGAKKSMRLSALAAIEGCMLFSILRMVCLVVFLELNFFVEVDIYNILSLNLYRIFPQ